MKKVIFFIIMCLCVNYVGAAQMFERFGNAARRVLNPTTLQSARVGIAAAGGRGMATVATEGATVASQPTLSWWQQLGTKIESPFKKIGQNWRQFRADLAQERKKFFELDVAHEMEKLRNLQPYSNNATFGELNSGNLGRVKDPLSAYRKAVNSGARTFLPEMDLKQALQGMNRSLTRTARDYFKTEALSDAQREAYKRLLREQMRKNNVMKAEILDEISQNQLRDKLLSKMEMSKSSSERVREMLKNTVEKATKSGRHNVSEQEISQLAQELPKWKQTFTKRKDQFVKEFKAVSEEVGLKENFQEVLQSLEKDIENIEQLELRVQGFMYL